MSQSTNGEVYAHRKELRKNRKKDGHSTRPLPGNGKGRLDPLMFPPKYARPIDDTPPIGLDDPVPLPGSGTSPNNDPVLTNPFSPPVVRVTPVIGPGGVPLDPTEPGYDGIPEVPHQDLKRLVSPQDKLKAPPDTPHPRPPQAASRPPEVLAPIPRLYGDDQNVYFRGGKLPRDLNVTDVKAIAKLYTRRAVEVLAEVMEDPEANASARVNAAEGLLNRGWGKPDVQAVLTVKKSVADFTDEEIMAILSSASQVIDAEINPETPATDDDGPRSYQPREGEVSGQAPTGDGPAPAGKKESY